MKAKNGFAGKYGVGLITMNAFLRAANQIKGKKIGPRIEKAFAFHGKPRPTGTSIQDWCFLNMEFIRAKGANHPSGNAEWVRPTRGPAHYFQPPPSNFSRPKFDPNSPEFLDSYEWRALRMKVLAHYGSVCMCCGASPSNSGEVMNVDHIKPRRLRPDLALDFDNLQVLCGSCNHGKSNWDQTDWRPVDKTQAEFDEGARAHLRLIARND